MSPLYLFVMMNKVKLPSQTIASVIASNSSEYYNVMTASQTTTFAICSILSEGINGTFS